MEQSMPLVPSWCQSQQILLVKRWKVQLRSLWLELEVYCKVQATARPLGELQCSRQTEVKLKH